MKKTKTDNHFYYLECVSCHKKTNEKETTSRCLSCGGPLDVIYDYEQLKLQLNTYLLRNSAPKVRKYLDFYPLWERQTLSSLDEGGTPLHWARNLGKKIKVRKLLIKNEGLNPTGVFKDRGSFVEINKARELGFTKVCVASTGNMAASVAAYSAQAEMECFVFVPEGTPKGKLAQSLSYGAKVIQVAGTYTDANLLAEQTAQKYGFYLAGDYVFRSEGQKSAGFELAEEMWWQELDWVIVPVGMGTNFAAISAIRKIIDKDDSLDFKLTDFNVEIPTTGSDATVEVTMVLQAKNGTQVVEKGVSPDIIVASMNAFVNGYNELVYQLKERR